MARRLWLAGSVMFVRNLDQSVSFYRELLGLKVTDSSPTAALLTSDEGLSLILRAAGPQAPHALGNLGVQYVAWVMPSMQDLDRCEQILRHRSAYRQRRTSGDFITVEGHDPDDLVVMLAYSENDRPTVRELPARAYAW